MTWESDQLTSPGLGVGGGAPAPAGASVANAAGSAGAGGSATPSWISSLSTSSIKTDMTAADVNGVVTAAGLTKLLTDLDATLSSSTLTSAEFTDLQTIATNLNNGLSTSSYLTYAFKALVNGNAANAYWTGGISYTASPYGSVLGNLAAGATKTKLGELTNKWFLGTDLPNSYVNMAGDSPFTVSYSTVANALFGASGPSVNDVNQGYLGDCYFEASCAEVAYENPSYIESMFSNNGNGTYGVRFYYDGTAEYVTVNLSLADSGTEFNQATYIWASLAEKAYAQFQAINLDTGNSGPSYNYGDSWSTIGNGGYIANALEALTGASVITGFGAYGASWIGETWNSSLSQTGYTPSLTTSSVLTAVEAALAARDDVDISSNDYAYDSSGNETLIPDHVLSVTGYDSGTQMLAVRNPWGDFDGYHYDGSTGKYYDPTFEVSLTTLLADGDWVEFDNVGGASALPNPATVAQYLSNISAYDQLAGGIQISDLAAAVAAGFDALNADSDIKSITLTDSGTPALNLTNTQAASDTTALGKIANQAFEVIAGGADTYYVRAGPLVSLSDSNATFKLSGGAQASVTGGGDGIAFAGSSDTVNLYSSGGSWDWVTGSGGTVNLNSAQTTVTGSGYTVEFAGGSGNAVGFYSTGGVWDAVSGSNGVVCLTSAQATVTGGGDWIDFVSGSGNAVGLYSTGGVWDGVSASNGTIDLTSAQATVTGGGDTIDFVSGSGNAVGLYSTGGVWDRVSGSNGAVCLTSAQATVTGGGDWIVFVSGSGNAVSLTSTGGVWDGVSASSGTIDLTSAQASVIGGGDTIDFLAGTGNTVGLYSTGGVWDTVTGSNGAVCLTSAQATVTGGGDWIDFVSGSGNAVSLASTGGVWDGVSASNGTINLTSAQASVVGGGDTINFVSGSGNTANLFSTGGVWDTVNGSNGAVCLTSAQASVTGGGDWIDFAGGSGNAVGLASTGGVWDGVSGSNGTISLVSAQAAVSGSTDTLNLSGTSTVTANGGSDAFVFGTAIGTEVINDFASTDTIQFSKSDFASWSALQPDIKQSGANTVITFNASNTVTLDGVTATTLTSSEFKFV